MINQTDSDIRNELDYDPAAGLFWWRKSGSGRNVNKPAGTKHHKGYVYVKVFGTSYAAHRLAWFFEHGYFPENDIDHLNRIRDDNRIANLREVSRSCNLRNTGNTKRNTSGTKGVSWIARKQKWLAHVRVNGASKYLGAHTDFAEAVAHRLAAEQCLEWPDCDSSSPAAEFMSNYLKNIKEEAQ